MNRAQPEDNPLDGDRLAVIDRYASNYVRHYIAILHLVQGWLQKIERFKEHRDFEENLNTLLSWLKLSDDEVEAI